MNRTMQYFKYMFTHHKKAIFLYTLVCFISYPLVAIFNLTDANSITSVIQLGMVTYMVYLVILCIIVPSISFKFINSKKAVDTYGALPISKFDMFLVHYLMPMLAICIPMLLNFILGTAILTFFSNAYSIMDFFEVIFVMIVTMKLMMVSYAMNTFFVNRCNSFIDGILVSLGMSALPYLVFLVIGIFADSQLVSTGNYIGDLLTPILSVFSPIFVAGSNLNDSMHYVEIVTSSNTLTNIWSYRYVFSWWHIYQLGVFVLFTISAYKSFKAHKNEDAEQITSDLFTYPLLITVAGLCLVSLVNFTNYDLFTAFILASITFVVFLVLNLIAKRSMKFSWKIIAKYAILLALFNGIAYISQQTEFFGINRRLVDLRDVKKIDIEINSNYEDKYEQGSLAINLEDGITASEQTMIDKLQNLQVKASEQHKKNEYGWNNQRVPYYDMVNINIRYITEYTMNNEKEMQILDYDFRHYAFDKNEIQDILGKIEMVDVNDIKETGID